MKPNNLDDRFGHLGKKIFIFLAGAAVLICAFFLMVAYKQNLFARTTSLYFFSDNATGINPGMAVKILGFNIGKVEDISIEPNAKVRVSMAVQSDFIRFITLGSRAKLFKEGMIGDYVIDISPGDQNLRPATHNTVLPFVRERDLSQIADELYGEIQPILKDAGKTMAAINDPEGDLQQSLRNINRATKSAQLLTEGVAARLPSIMDKADSIAKTANEGLPILMESSRQSLDNVRDATNDLKRIASVSAQELPTVLQDSRSLVRDGVSIVNGVKESWPVRNMIDRPQEYPLPIDSYVQPQPIR